MPPIPSSSKHSYTELLAKYYGWHNAAGNWWTPDGKLVSVPDPFYQNYAQYWNGDWGTTQEGNPYIPDIGEQIVMNAALDELEHGTIGERTKGYFGQQLWAALPFMFAGMVLGEGGGGSKYDRSAFGGWKPGVRESVFERDSYRNPRCSTASSPGWPSG